MIWPRQKRDWPVASNRCDYCGRPVMWAQRYTIVKRGCGENDAAVHMNCNEPDRLKGEE